MYVCAFFILILAVWIKDFVEFADFNKQVSYTDAERPCSFIQATLDKEIRAEDIVMINDHLAIVPSDDRARLWHFNDNGTAPSVGGP